MEVLRKVGENRIFCANEEVDGIQSCSTEVVRCFHLYINSVDTPITYKIAYKLFQDVRRRISENLQLMLR